MFKIFFCRIENTNVAVISDLGISGVRERGFSPIFSTGADFGSMAEALIKVKDYVVDEIIIAC